MIIKLVLNEEDSDCKHVTLINTDNVPCIRTGVKVGQPAIIFETEHQILYRTCDTIEEANAMIDAVLLGILTDKKMLELGE